MIDAHALESVEEASQENITPVETVAPKLAKIKNGRRLTRSNMVDVDELMNKPKMREEPSQLEHE